MEAGSVVTQHQSVYKDGQLWQADSSLSAAQNTKPISMLILPSTGSPTIQTLLNAPFANVADVSAAAEAEATTVPGLTSNYFQDTLFN